jgi:TonB family protein
MWRRIVPFILLAASLIAQPVDETAQSAMARGIVAFRQAKYSDAVSAFELAVKREPGNSQAHSYLGSALMVQWIPGADSPDNVGFADRAEAEFRAVLAIDPRDKRAIASLASLEFNRAKPIPADFHLSERSARFDNAETWYRRLSEVDPNDKTAYYSRGVIAWERFYPALQDARVKLGMRPEDPGPLRDSNTRVDLRSRYGAAVEEGIANLRKAIEIDPAYDDAMAYLNLLYRERGELSDTADGYNRDVETADAFVVRALELKKHKLGSSGYGPDSGSPAAVIGAPPAPTPPAPPPPPPPQQGSSIPIGATPTPVRIRVGGNVQAANLLSKADPVYPPLGRQAGVQGVVRFNVIIGKDGHVESVQLVSGHPILVASATEAVKQYVYKPTLLNGQPVEVMTQVEVNFTLAN